MVVAPSVELDLQVVSALRSRLRGPVIAAGEPGYEAARTVWNGMIDRRPAMVARCLGTEDVISAVRFAGEQGLAVSVKGGGHNIAGLAVADGALLLDMSLMRGVWVDVQERRARAQAGALLGDFDRETQLHGLATPLGFVSNTGVAGLTLGGGFGYLTRRLGWAADSVVAMDVVTADGRLVRASEQENEDLFWALRGGGGNFGIVTGFEFRLYPVGPEIVGGAIAWPAERAAEVFEIFRSLSEEGPPEIGCIYGLRKAPPAPWIDKEFRGKDITALFICHSGEVAAAEKALKPVKELGGAVGDIVQRRQYVTQQNLLDGTQPSGRRYYWKSEYVAGLDRNLGRVAGKHASTITSPHSAILMMAMAGPHGNLPAGHSAVGNHDAAAVFNVAGSWEQPADDEANIRWVRSAWEDLRKFSTGGTYVNFLSHDEGADRLEHAYGGQLSRLREVKAKWDPGNFFHLNRNISPR